MRQPMNLFLVATAALLAASCSSDDPWTDLNEWTDNTGNNSGTTINGGSSGSSGASTEVASFDIAIDESALSETETIPTDEGDTYYEDYVENNTFATTVTINYNGNTATCADEVRGVTVTIDGADVTVNSTVKGVNYILQGTTNDGMFKIYSEKKYQLTLNGVSIKNNDGPAINSQCGKRCYVVAVDGTTNTFTDGTSYATSTEDQKATIFSEGELLFSGSGSIKVYANAKSGIASDDYVFIRPNTNIYVKATANHGIKSNDGIMVKGGVINIETSATAAKGLKTDGFFQMDGGRIVAITTGGGEYDSDEKDVSACAGVKADSIIVINGGELRCKSTGKGGKGISTDQTFTINDGVVKVITAGATYTYSSQLDSKAKGIKADGDLTINGGQLMVRASGGEGSEGIESKGVLTVNSGLVEVYSYDDCINSASHMYIKGGYVYVYATGNDGLDANGNLYFQGGTVVAYGTRQPECGIDANEEGGYTVYFQGGNVFAIGGGNSVPSNSQSTQGYITASGSVSANTQATISSGSTTLATFDLPYGYSSGSIVVTANGMTSGSSYTLTIGGSSVSATASQYGSGGMGMGGGGFPGGGPGGRW